MLSTDVVAAPAAITLPLLTPVASVQLGSRPDHTMGINLAISGGLLYATHSYALKAPPHTPDGHGNLVTSTSPI